MFDATSLTGLWSLPKKKIYIAFLAGMLNDAFIISIIIIVFWLSDQGFVFGISIPWARAGVGSSPALGTTILH